MKGKIRREENLFWEFYTDAKIRSAMEGIFIGKPMPNNPEMQLFWLALDKALKDMTSGKQAPAALNETAHTITSGKPVTQK